MNTANTQNKSLIQHDQYLLRHFMKPIFRRKIGWKLSDVDLRILEVKLKTDPRGYFSSRFCDFSTSSQCCRAKAGSAP